ncbi:MAG: hypothetical protein GY765_41810 [bacterium]|nr:hypothetical protein [bacterium]
MNKGTNFDTSGICILPFVYKRQYAWFSSSDFSSAGGGFYRFGSSNGDVIFFKGINT